MRAFALVWLAACATSPAPEMGGGGGGGKGDNGSGSGDFVEAPHLPAPRVGTAGGVVIASPKAVPVFFGEDPARASFEAMLNGIAGSSYWTANTTEYGVGPLTIDASVVATDPAPTDQTALETWLVAKYPTPDPDTIYTVFLPENVTFTAFSTQSCTGWSGYHEMVASNGLIYALIPRCPTTTGVALDTEMIAASHELIEAATDPHPDNAPAYNQPDPAYPLWAWGYSELGDMCAFVPAANQPLIGNYVVQRSWSNASAAAGHDPCVPALAEPYIAASPASAQVAVAQGATQVVEVTLFSDGPTEDFTVGVSGTYGSPTSFTTTWDKQTGHNGDKLQLSITRNVPVSPYDLLVLEAKRGDVVVSQWWLAVQ